MKKLKYVCCIILMLGMILIPYKVSFGRVVPNIVGGGKGNVFTCPSCKNTYEYKDLEFIKKIGNNGSTHIIVCKCGFKSEEEKHTYTYNSISNIFHRKECEICGYPDGRAPHELDEDGICEDCGFDSNEIFDSECAKSEDGLHNFLEGIMDIGDCTKHQAYIYYYCEYCNLTIAVMPINMHKLNSKGICEVCGEDFSECNHEITSEPANIESLSGHEIICALCGQYFIEDHEYGDDDICDICGYENTGLSYVDGSDEENESGDEEDNESGDKEDKEDKGDKGDRDGTGSGSGGGGEEKDEEEDKEKDGNEGGNENEEKEGKDKVDQKNCNHKYSEFSYDYKYHNATCTICGNELWGEHSFSNNKCTVCGYEKDENNNPDHPDNPNEEINSGDEKDDTDDEDMENRVDYIFDDINKDDWYYDAVQYVVDEGLFNGISEHEFGPNMNMTRGMLVTVLYRLSGAKTKKTATFIDVEEDAYYSNAIYWANNKGIVNGIGDSKFAPDRDVTREELATIIAKYISKMNVKKSNVKGIEVGFNDEDEIADYAKKYVETMQKKGLMQGKNGNNFDPKGNATRAEVATILMRLNEK